MRIFIALSLSLVAGLASAQQVYKWKDANGIVHYGDKPMNSEAAPADLPALQIYGLSNGKKATRTGAPYGGNGPHGEITQPGADSILRQAEGKFTVNVDVTPALSFGQNLLYFLDGTQQNRTATQATSFQYFGAGRGDHMVSVAVVDDGGHELSRSEPVIVHVQPAAVAAAAPPPAPPAPPKPTSTAPAPP